MDYPSNEEQTAWMQGEVETYCGVNGIRVEEERIRAAARYHESNYYFGVAKEEGKLVGYLAGFREHPTLPDCQEIAALHVRRDRVGQGIGSRLLSRFFREVGTSRPTVLDVVEGVLAVKFYEARGFKEMSKEQWGPLPALRMKWEAGDEV
jgi:GNAT superfamily N-acetyltransferase